MSGDKDRVLFLDDMRTRHAAFVDLCPDNIYLVRVETAAAAIDRLSRETFFQVFLDHDLSEEDIMVEVGKPTKVPTGMAVVDFLVANPDRWPDEVVIHTCNTPAAEEMARRLREAKPPGTRVSVVPFPQLITAMGIAHRSPASD